jgi:GT2 family glycosyltransferase
LPDTIATGWAWNPSDPSKPVKVDFYVGHEIVGSCKTHMFRKDVEVAGYASGRCGFRTELRIDLAGKAAIEVRAKITETGKELVDSPRIATRSPIMRGLLKKKRVTGAFLWRLRRRLDRETGGLLSIVMPVYNPDEQWLRDALESVRNQWCGRWELLCVDDGSPSPSARQIIEEYASRDDRVHYLRLENNGGIAKATNRGIFAARGAYIAFMDQDDYLEPDAVYWLLRTTTEGAKVIYSDEITTTPTNIDSLHDICARPAFSYDFYLSHPYFVHIVCVERSLAQNIGGWDETMKVSSDVDFVLRALQNTDRVAHVPRILYRWRTHGRSAGHVLQAQVTAATLGALNRHLSQVFPGTHATKGLIYNQHKIDFPDDLGKTMIVIPTKNREDLLRSCIQSIWATTTSDDVQIVVIDHDSDSLPARQYLRSISDKVQIVSYSGPFNFSAMNNYAIACAQRRARYILFMNNDVEAIERGWLERLRSIANRPDVGIVGATLLYGDRTIQHSGVIIGIGGVADHAHRFSAFMNPTDEGRRYPGYLTSLVSLRDYSAVTAACMMMRREIFDSVGGFDEKLMVGFNDTDFCLRVGKLGMKILNDPYAVLYHHESATRSVANLVNHPEDNAQFTDRWKNFIRKGDPFYNPLLSLTGIDHIAKDGPIITQGVREVAVSPPGRAPRLPLRNGAEENM